MRFRGVKLILGIFIPFLCFFVMSQNTSAISSNGISNSYIWRYYSGSASQTYGLVNTGAKSFNTDIWNYGSAGGVRIGRFQFSANANISGLSDYTQVDADFKIRVMNISAQTTNFTDILPSLSTNYGVFESGSCWSYQSGLESGFATQSWHCTYYTSNISNISSLWVNFGSVENGDTISSGLVNLSYNAQIVFFDYSYASSLSPSSQAIINALNAGNNTIINQNSQIINQNQQVIDKENQAIDNIENQDSSDISDAENQATTNLIGVFSSLLNELGNFQASSCVLVLPLPNFIGGQTSVNICQGKDVFGNLITLIGSLTMICFYIPLALVLVKMIYNEIRSFTNG